MGKTRAEQTANFKTYINKGVMNRYAENFGKGLTNKDIMYYAKIHHTRDGKTGDQMHVHIIISRKDITKRKNKDLKDIKNLDKIGHQHDKHMEQKRELHNKREQAQRQEQS